MFVKCSIGVFLCDICPVWAGPRNVVLCSHEVAGRVTAGGVVLPWLNPHISGGRHLPSLSRDPRDSMSWYGWKLLVGTSGLPGRGRVEPGAWLHPE